jgi:hypothetical protein
MVRIGSSQSGIAGSWEEISCLLTPRPSQLKFFSWKDARNGRERLARGREEAAARRSLAGRGKSLHLEVDLNSQVNRCGFTIEDRGFIFSCRNGFERRLDQ